MHRDMNDNMRIVMIVHMESGLRRIKKIKTSIESKLECRAQQGV